MGKKRKKSQQSKSSSSNENEEKRIFYCNSRSLIWMKLAFILRSWSFSFFLLLLLLLLFGPIVIHSSMKSNRPHKQNLNNKSIRIRLICFLEFFFWLRILFFHWSIDIFASLSAFSSSSFSIWSVWKSFSRSNRIILCHHCLLHTPHHSLLWSNPFLVRCGLVWISEEENLILFHKEK